MAAAEGMGWKVAQELDEELSGLHDPLWERSSSFDVIPGFVARGHDGPASQGDLRSGGHPSQ